jgi:hypothetical protein
VQSFALPQWALGSKEKKQNGKEQIVVTVGILDKVIQVSKFDMLEEDHLTKKRAICKSMRCKTGV